MLKTVVIGLVMCVCVCSVCLAQTAGSESTLKSPSNLHVLLSLIWPRASLTASVFAAVTQPVLVNHQNRPMPPRLGTSWV